MPEIARWDFELKKIITNGQRTEDTEIETDTLVLSNTNLELRVKGEPHIFKNFIPGSLITIAFTQSQTTMTDFDKEEEDDLGDVEEEDDLKDLEGTDDL